MSFIPFQAFASLYHFKNGVTGAETLGAQRQSEKGFTRWKGSVGIDKHAFSYVIYYLLLPLFSVGWGEGNL